MYQCELDNAAVETRTALMGPSEKEIKQRRHIEAGSWYDLWLLYQGIRLARNDTAASWSTFLRAMKAWIPCLKFRTKCQFGKCPTCVKYKQLIKEALIVEVRVYWTNGYTKHLTSQYADRATAVA